MQYLKWLIPKAFFVILYLKWLLGSRGVTGKETFLVTLCPGRRWHREAPVLGGLGQDKGIKNPRKWLCAAPGTSLGCSGSLLGLSVKGKEEPE